MNTSAQKHHLTKYVFGRDFNLGEVHHLSAARRREAMPVRWHYHEQTEIHIMLSGELAYEFRKQAGVTVSGMHFLVIPAGVAHHAVRGFEQPSVRLGVLFDAATAATASSESSFFRQCEAVFLQTPVTSCPLGAEALDAAKKLFDMVERNGFERVEKHAAAHDGRRMDAAYHRVAFTPCEQVRLRSLCCLALADIAATLEAGAPVFNNPLVAKVCGYLESHLREAVAMDEVAAAFGCSRSHLFTVFKAATGMSPNDYLLRARVREAQRLLARGATNMTETAFDVGFSSSQYFAKVFRKYTGVAPSGYAARLPRP